MKKKYAHIVITFFCGIMFSYGQVSDLIISEYVEGSSNNKYIEIYNGTGSAVDLTDYEVWRAANGNAWPDAKILPTGTLADGATYVIAHTLANGTILAAADLTSYNASWNGDDAVGLAKDIAGTFTLIDAVGVGGVDPGTAWNVAGTNNATANHTLVRKVNTCAPNTNWVTSAGTTVANSEWVVTAVDDFASLDSHTSVCTDTYLNFAVASSTLVENGVSIDVCVSILNPSASVATTVDIILDGSSSATNGTDYDDGTSAISFPVTVTFPANTTADQCLTIFIAIDDLVYEGDETVVLDLTNPTGGTAADLGGNTNHVLTILDDETPVIADVVITEIMYNTTGGDDEWIEICNTTGLDQVLNNYSVEVNGTPRFTFPSTGTIIAGGDCILVAIRDSGGAFNPGCNFTTIYNDNVCCADILINSPTGVGVDIELIASDGSTIVDAVNYDDNDLGGPNNAADGGGSSLHVTDDSLDNSDTASNWQFVADGGSPGFNTLISQCSSMEPEINVEGDINTFPNIYNADIMPSYLDNTLFSDDIPISSSETKSFRIQNIGTADLIVSNIEIIGANAGDFSVTPPSAFNIIIEDISTMTNLEVFDVTFTPTVAGERNATVRITNNDSADGEGEEVFVFAIRGVGICTSAVNTVTPLSGPDNTVVTISGNDLGGTTSVTFAGSAIAHTVVSPTEIEVSIPDASISGNIVVTNNLGCQTSDFFTVIDNLSTSCQGTSGLSPTDLFISEITDAPYGSHTYIEIFNGTGAPVNLADYEIRIHHNGSANAGGDIADLDAGVTMPNNSVYVIGIGGVDSTDPEGGYTADDFFSLSGVNNNDNIRLYTDDGTTETWIDVWGRTDGTAFTTAPKGYTYRRKNTGITVPRTDNWQLPDDMQDDWLAYSPVNYDDIGNFDFSAGDPPLITDEPDPMDSPCDTSATFSLSADQGYLGGLPLAYQWFVSVPGVDGWTALSNGAPYSGATTATLTISNTVGLYNYQYYCQVRENLNTCYTASEAVRVTTKSTTWVSPGNWDNNAPDINTIAVLDFNYDTTVNGSFSACSLTIDSGTLVIKNGDYVEIQNDLIVNGNLEIDNEGSLVMIDDTGTVSGSGNTNVYKTTTEMETYDYTYWSPPVDYSVSGTSAQTVLTGFRPSRIYGFDTSEFSDLDADSFDDDNNSWTPHFSSMSSGIGYAAMSNGTGSHFRSITFNGPLNTGIIPVTVALSGNGADSTDDWNLLGNPYPSAISVDTFVSHNANLSGTVYLWTHEDDISISNPGPDAYNFNSNDYAMYNAIGGVGTASTGTVTSFTPLGYIASGQGFFIDAITAGTVEFTNGMRNKTYSNNEFFRNSDPSTTTTAFTEKDRMWLNLTNPDGAFSQILIGYVDDGTLGKDRLYDGIRMVGSNYIDFYSKDETNLYKYGIQGRPPFTIEDVVPLGYDSGILGELTIALYKAEGELSDINIYLRDNLLNTIHELNNSHYTFTTEDGNFTNRFEIIYQTDALSIGENEISQNDITIIELQNGSVKFSVGNNLTISTIEIIDLLGRTLYNLKGNNSTEIFELNNLSQTAYIAKISLSNGQTITKRAIKRN
ncbi:lamin tail domain-containing protein [Psychroserpens ponticola]|uniref:Lamin tail domain-containing protein n=1 Tax=Psychroserpens ponticola TaxID=2932268 RepID=A0ABY7RWK6_9FLAO|nr:lamin tail domain-containing protein [Psychroserpens ponticola]WCO01494.1 lamin tail domain-containing protein [Psychroserpens ponticola]